MPRSPRSLRVSLAWAGVIVALAASALACRDRAPRRRTYGPPRRIASTMVAATEILLELVPPQRLVAVTRFGVDPKFSVTWRRARRIKGRIVSASAESILAHHPDLAILAGYARAEVQAHLRRAGVRVVVLEAVTGLAPIRRNIVRLGAVTGTPRAAQRLLRRLDRALAKVRRSWPKGRVRPEILSFAHGYVAGRATSFDAVARAAGARNLARRLGIRGHARVSPEVIWRANPRWVLLQADSRAAALRLARRTKILQRLAAVGAGRVLYLPQALLACASHHVIRAVRLLAAQLHPARRP